ncbi:hypothetical protein [Noviherbaspirillum agri]
MTMTMGMPCGRNGIHLTLPECGESGGESAQADPIQLRQIFSDSIAGAGLTLLKRAPQKDAAILASFPVPVACIVRLHAATWQVQWSQRPMKSAAISARDSEDMQWQKRSW